MTVDLDQLKQRIETHVWSPWSVYTNTSDGPVVRDEHGNQVFSIDVGHAVWTCDDEQDGCSEVSQDAVALAKLLVDLPGYALELIQVVNVLLGQVQDLEIEIEAWEGREL